MRSAEIIHLLFSPKGTVTRVPFVIGLLIMDVLVIISLLLLVFTPVFVLHMIGADVVLHHAKLPAMSMSVVITLLIFSLLLTSLYIALYGALLWSHFCLMVKRLRDIKLSVWYVIYPYACTAVAGSIYTSQILNSGLSLDWMLTKLVAVVGGFLFVLILTLWPSRV